MKNEIGRKLTSLTLMTIMFAGGMTLAIPGFLPESAIPIEAFADQGTTSGMLYVSSTTIVGAQVLQITVDDPSLSTTGSNAQVEVDITSGSTTETMELYQGTDGLYHGFVVDDVTAEYAEAQTITSLDFGLDCDVSLDSNAGTAGGFLGNQSGDIDMFIEGSSCTATGTTNNTPFTVLQNEVQAAGVGSAGQPGPANIGNLDGTGGVGAVAGQIAFMYAVDLTDGDNLIEYGSDAVVVVWDQNGGDGGSISTSHTNVVPGQYIHLTIDDNALNIDPTTIDAWTFEADATPQTDRSSIDTTDLTTHLGNLGFGGSAVLSLTEDTTISSDSMSVEATTANTFTFTETGTNTGVFTTHNGLGVSDASVLITCTVDDQVTFGYNGTTAILVCVTNTASASLDAGAEWFPGEAASYTVNDPDQNKNPSLVETLNVQDNNVIPTIRVGSLYKYLEVGALAAVTSGVSGISI